KLKNGIELCRLFIWRNSGCQLNLNISYLEISKFKPRKWLPFNGFLKPEMVEPDLLANGVAQNQFGIIVAIFTPAISGRNLTATKILGNAAFCSFQYPFKTSVQYPGESADTDYKAAWLFIEGFQHALEKVCYAGSGAPEMWRADQPWKFALKAGEHFSYQAEILRQYHSFLEIKPPWGTVHASSDRDGDHFPDEDPRVPMDEFRFGSSDSKKDTDDDGLDDLNEFMAGIFKGSDPGHADSDRDGFIDGVDPFPLHAIQSKIPKITPSFNTGTSSWNLVCQTLDHSSANFFMDIPLNMKFFMNWDDDNLYIGCLMDVPAKLHLDLDLLNDGWWNGKDNYRLVVDPFSDRFYQIHAMDATPEAQQLHESLYGKRNVMWDDDPEYSRHFGQILDETSLTLKIIINQDRYWIMIRLPYNSAVPFRPQANHRIGMRIYFEGAGLGETESWATIFEPYQFFDVILK
ncbi:MAG: hypothetical protein SCK70_15005, partial [bacterium]|nr:hypothetical protein [bacterium]